MGGGEGRGIGRLVVRAAMAEGGGGGRLGRGRLVRALVEGPWSLFLCDLSQWLGLHGLEFGAVSSA